MKLITNLLLFSYAITLILFVNDPELTYIETYISYTCLAFLLLLKLFKNIPIYFPKFSFVYFFFCIFCFASYLINETIDTSALSTFIQIQIFLIVILNLIVLTNEYRFLIYGIIAGLLYNIIVANLIGRDFFGDIGYRFAGSLKNPNHYAFLLVFSIAFLLYYLRIFKQNLLSRIISILFIAILAYEVIFYAASRGGYLSLFIIILIYNIDAIVRQNLFSKIIISIASISFIYFVLIRIESNFLISNRINSIFGLLSTQSTFDVSFNYRIMYIRQALDYWISNPFFGIGLDQFRNLNQSSYSHNNYIEILATTGFFGFLTYYFSIFKLLLTKYVDGRTALMGKIFIVLLLISDFSSVNILEKPFWIIFVLSFFIINNDFKKNSIVL
tara:strand:+ start:16523 stop:17680 length:1158 start_codon:yes stop_codon:yes gene_type:complete